MSFWKQALRKSVFVFLPGDRKQMDLRKLDRNITLVRVELDLTQTRLAEKINAKQKSISRYENGASLPSIKTFVKIARVLKKATGYFLDE